MVIHSPRTAETTRACPARPARPTRHRVPAQIPRAAHLTRLHGPRPSRRAHPEPDRIARTLAQLLLEVLTGRRPLDKLVALARHPVPERLLALLRRGVFRPQQGLLPVLRNVHTSTPEDHGPVIEACASIQLPDGRVEMLAFRVEHLTRPRPTWQLTALNARQFPR